MYSFLLSDCNGIQVWLWMCVLCMYFTIENTVMTIWSWSEFALFLTTNLLGSVGFDNRSDGFDKLWS